MMITLRRIVGLVAVSPTLAIATFLGWGTIATATVGDMQCFGLGAGFLAMIPLCYLMTYAAGALPCSWCRLLDRLDERLDRLADNGGKSR
jgi:hypothetical protein